MSCPEISVSIITDKDRESALLDVFSEGYWDGYEDNTSADGRIKKHYIRVQKLQKTYETGFMYGLKDKQAGKRGNSSDAMKVWDRTKRKNIVPPAKLTISEGSESDIHVSISADVEAKSKCKKKGASADMERKMTKPQVKKLVRGMVRDMQKKVIDNIDKMDEPTIWDARALLGFLAQQEASDPEAKKALRRLKKSRDWYSFDL